MFFRRIAFVCLLIWLFLALGACRGQRTTSTPVPLPPTGDATVSAPEGAASATVEQQVTAATTSTIAAGATLPGPVVLATATPAPTATPLPEPTVTATPAALLLLSKEDFGNDRNPLTGELVADPAVLQRRPIAVKISNAPAEYTRPQAGLSQADLVFEHATEGPITRFTAVFYGQTPPDVGPIRSARLIDVEIPAMYDAGLAYSGSSIGVSQRLGGSDFRSRLIRSNEPGYYRTGEDKPWEHTLHGDPAGFWQALEANGENHAPAFDTYMAFSSEPPTGGEPANTITFKYRDWTTIEWRYDPQSGRYYRWADGVAHLDSNTGQQISAANVVAVYATHQLNFSICEYQTDSGCQAFSTEIQLWSQGAAVIFRDGLRYDAIWKREGRNDMLTFYDYQGNPLPLQIGNTWFQVIPYHYDEPVTWGP